MSLLFANKTRIIERPCFDVLLKAKKYYRIGEARCVKNRPRIHTVRLAGAGNRCLGRYRRCLVGREQAMKRGVIVRNLIQVSKRQRTYKLEY